MENMMWDPHVIRKLAQPTIPAAVCDAIARQGSVLCATDTMRSLALSAFDLEVHDTSTSVETVGFDGIAQSVCAQYGSRLGGPHPRDRRWWVAHTHMTGYASM